MEPILVSVPTKPTVLMFGNIRGLITSNNVHKMSLIKDLVVDKNCFMVCLTESHLNQYIEYTESDMEGQEQIRSDRKQRIGGGVICYVKDCLSVTNSTIFSNSYCESVCYSLPTINTVNITIYRPPGCPCEKFGETLQKVKNWL